jgi:glycogen(starch) synthase
MRVLMTADTVGGVWTYAMELTRALPAIEFTLATMGRRATKAQREEIPDNVTLAESDYKLEWERDPWNDVVHAGAWLLDLEFDTAPDLIHLNGYAHGVLPFRAPKIVVSHSCVLSWWRAVHGEEAPAEWDAYRDHVERGLRSAEFVVAPSEWMLGQLHQNYDFNSPSRTIYNARTQFPLPRGDGQGGRRVFAAGRLWDEAKNLNAVIAAAPKIAWPVRVAGDGGASGPNVEHLGKLGPREMARAYAESAIYLFPALYEPFGLSVLEAALSGCALILGDLGSLREIWGDAALYVPPRDANEIARVTNEVIADESLRNDLAQRARARAARYTPAAMAAEYVQLYDSLTAHAESGASHPLTHHAGIPAPDPSRSREVPR